MTENNFHWEQRFSNFNKALKKLSEAIDFIKQHQESEIDLNQTLDEIIKEGLFHRFEYTHELAWNIMKDYAGYQGNNMIGGSRDASREAFQLQLISD